MTVSYDGALRVYSKASNLLLTVPVSTDALTCIVTKKINVGGGSVPWAGWFCYLTLLGFKLYSVVYR